MRKLRVVPENSNFPAAVRLSSAGGELGTELLSFGRRPRRAALPKGPAAVKAVVPLLEKDIKDADVRQIQKALKDDFAAAEAKWDQGKTVP